MWVEDVQYGWKVGNKDVKCAVHDGVFADVGSGK